MIKNITRKGLLAILFSVSLILSCKDNNEVALDKCFVTNITYQNGEATFAYTADNKLSALTSTFLSGGVPTTEPSTIQYNTKGNIFKVESPGSYSEYTYTANNQVTTEYLYEGTALIDRRDYEYNSSGQLVKKQSYDISSDGTEEKISYRTYEYSSTTSQNPSTGKFHFSDGEIISIFEFEYDDKKTFYSAIAPGVIFATVAAEENNVTQIIEKTEAGDIYSKTTYVYLYNDKGYPTKVTRTALYPGGTDTFSREYTYNCK